MIEGNPHILPEIAQVMAMLEAEKRKGTGEELKPEINMPTFGQLIRNTLVTLLGRNVPKP